MSMFGGYSNTHAFPQTLTVSPPATDLRFSFFHPRSFNPSKHRAFVVRCDTAVATKQPSFGYCEGAHLVVEKDLLETMIESFEPKEFLRGQQCTCDHNDFRVLIDKLDHRLGIGSNLPNRHWFFVRSQEVFLRWQFTEQTRLMSALLSKLDKLLDAVDFAPGGTEYEKSKESFEKTSEEAKKRKLDDENVSKQ